MVFTDEYKAYERLGRTGYTHRRINHQARVYVDGDVHTQTIDGFFGLFKNRRAWRASRRLAQVAAGLLERVDVALQPRARTGTRCSAICIDAAASTRRLGLLGRVDDLAEGVHETSLRFGTGISKPCGVVCVGSSLGGCCASFAIRGEVSCAWLTPSRARGSS